MSQVVLKLYEVEYIMAWQKYPGVFHRLMKLFKEIRDMLNGVINNPVGNVDIGPEGGFLMIIIDLIGQNI